MQIEEEEGGDSFDINISVSDPEKVGECSLISWNILDSCNTEALQQLCYCPPEAPQGLYIHKVLDSLVGLSLSWCQRKNH